MRKTLNGKSSRCVVSKERNCHRLKAVSDYSFCEVRPGVGPVRKKDNIIAGSGITHVTCTERRMRVIELYSLKEWNCGYTSSLCKAGDGVFLYQSIQNRR